MSTSEPESLSLFTDKPQYGGDDTITSINELIKRACRDRAYPTVAYILSAANTIPLEPIDNYGNTILHFVIAHIDQFGRPLLQRILRYPSIRQIINVRATQEQLTPAMLAARTYQNDIVNMLVSAGADLRIPNAMGDYIVTETNSMPQTLSMGFTTPTQNVSTLSSVGRFLSSLTAPFTSTLGFNTNAEILQPPVVIGQPAEMMTQPMSSLGFRSTSPFHNAASLPTSEYIQHIINRNVSVNNNANIENNRRSIIAPMSPNNIQGGNTAVAVGQRALNQYFDYSSMSGGESPKEYETDSSSNSSNSSSESPTELAREVDNIHTRTVETIKKLMDVDEEIAKIYKSVLYRRVRKEQPDLSGFKRAEEMEKLAIKEELQKIDISKETDLRKKEREEREEPEKTSSESEKPKKGKKTTKAKKGKTEKTEEKSEEKPKKTRKSKNAKKDESSSETSSPKLTSELTQ